MLQAALKERTEALSVITTCPITHEPMVDPVSAADGQTYERKAIERWFGKCGAGEWPLSPLTGEPLKDKTLRPNLLARALVLSPPPAAEEGWQEVGPRRAWTSSTYGS